MKKYLHEYRLFLSYPWDMRTLIVTNLVYGLFILLAYRVSDTFALRYALLVIGLVQLLSVPLARTIVKGCAACGLAPADELATAEV